LDIIDIDNNSPKKQKSAVFDYFVKYSGFLFEMWVTGIASAGPKALDFCTEQLRADQVVMAVFGLTPSALYEVFGISDG
jgi:hypothetical protein